MSGSSGRRATYGYGRRRKGARQAVRSFFGRSWRRDGLGSELRRSWRYSTGRSSVTEGSSPGFEKSPVRTAFSIQNVGIMSGFPGGRRAVAPL
jgi:hypothetical protein